MSSCLPYLLTPGETIVSALQFPAEISFSVLLSISPALVSLTVLSFVALHVPDRIHLYIFFFIDITKRYLNGYFIWSGHELDYFITLYTGSRVPFNVSMILT